MNEDQLRHIATYGTWHDLWKIEVYKGDVLYETYMGTGSKWDMYGYICNALTYHNDVTRILVYRNDRLHQTITVSNAPEENNTSTA